MANRITLRQLEYFTAVGKLGSIVRAAEMSNVSSPSISSAITLLEEEFGLSLFVRKRAHGLSLTQAGAQIMAQAEQVLRETEALNRLASDIAKTVRGPLSVGCLLTFAQIIVPRLRRDFEMKNSQVQVQQFELHQMEIFDRLRRAKIDVALTYDMDIPTDLEFIPLLPLHPFVMVHSDHPLAHLPVITIEDLRNYAMILLDLPHSSEYFLSFFSDAGYVPKIAERTRDMAVMRSLVANGYGYAIANIRPLSDHAPDGMPLKFIPLSGDVKPMQLGVVIARGAESALTIRAFIEHCQQSITEESSLGLASVKGT